MGGLVAIAGGLLRAASSFAPVVIGSGLARESLYIVVDVCLTVGLIGFYLQRSDGRAPLASRSRSVASPP